MNEFKPGDEITIGYTGYTVDAKVLEVAPEGRYGPQRGWLMVEQISDTNYGTRYAGATYEAAVEFCVPRGETPPTPLAKLYERN